MYHICISKQIFCKPIEMAIPVKSLEELYDIVFKYTTYFV